MPRIRTHPGHYLSEEYLKPLEMSARQLAQAIAVPPNRVTDINREHRGVTADTARRLARYFGTTPQFWLNLQTAFDLSKSEAEDDLSMIRPRDVAA